MQKYLRSCVVLLFVAACASFSFPAGTRITRLSASDSFSAAGGQDGEQTAEQVYRNIQALKGVPASQLQQVMALFTGSLGVRCSYCHTNQMESDAKPAKQTARRMIQMVFDLNHGTFAGKGGVTCYTCHRGQPKPLTIVELGINLWQTPPKTDAKTEAPLPSADEILARYIQALGGREALSKLTARISKGSRVGADGVLVPEEVYEKAPNKLLVVTKYPGRSLTVGFNGERAWNGDQERVSEVTGGELAELQREATFNKELSLRDLYLSMNVAGVARIGGKEACVIVAKSRAGNPEKLYFDTGTGLLVRRYWESTTVFGPFPLQTDYEDYQRADGVMIPLTIRWSMPGRSWGRRIAEVEQNVLIEDERFTPPPAKR